MPLSQLYVESGLDVILLTSVASTLPGGAPAILSGGSKGSLRPRVAEAVRSRRTLSAERRSASAIISISAVNGRGNRSSYSDAARAPRRASARSHAANKTYRYSDAPVTRCGQTPRHRVGGRRRAAAIRITEPIASMASTTHSAPLQQPAAPEK